MLSLSGWYLKMCFNDHRVDVQKLDRDKYSGTDSTEEEPATVTKMEYLNFNIVRCLRETRSTIRLTDSRTDGSC